MDGRLAEHFVGVGVKRISATEAPREGVSHGHELAASGPVADLLGRERRQYTCQYFYFTEDIEDGEYLSETSTITFYDARENSPARRSPEWRLYFPYGCAPAETMAAGDFVWVATRKNGQVLVAIAQDGSAVARQLGRLFGTGLPGLSQPTPERAARFTLFDLGDAVDEDLDLADADLLLALGITPQAKNEDLLAAMIERFGGTYPLPTTADFTSFARRACKTADPSDDPDRALYDWVSLTNDLFFAYERHVLQPILDAELANREHIDVDAFFALATKFKNSRFSRAGRSFEHHIAALFDALNVRYSCPSKMADGSKPDFLLPTLEAYNDASMPQSMLTFVAAKTTAKERWRQVVTEATRIEFRHLWTMDRELYGDVLSAMRKNLVFPVVPNPIRQGYDADLVEQMMSVRDFVTLAQERDRWISHRS